MTKKDFKKNINYSFNDNYHKNLKKSKFKEKISYFKIYYDDNEYNEYNESRDYKIKNSFEFFNDDEDNKYIEDKYKKELKNKINISIISSQDILQFKFEYNQIIKFISEHNCKNNIFGKKIIIDKIFNGKEFHSNISYKDIIDISSMLSNISNISLSINLYLKFKKFTKNFGIIKF